MATSSCRRYPVLRSHISLPYSMSLSKGTHTYSKFIKPSELIQFSSFREYRSTSTSPWITSSPYCLNRLEAECRGLIFNPLQTRWHLASRNAWGAISSGSEAQSLGQCLFIDRLFFFLSLSASSPLFLFWPVALTLTTVDSPPSATCFSARLQSACASSMAYLDHKFNHGHFLKNG